MTSYPMTHYFVFRADDDGSKLTLRDDALTRIETSNSIDDNNSDGDLDITSDTFWNNSHLDFSGYYYTGTNGLTYPIFVQDNATFVFYVPYNEAEYNLFADFSTFAGDPPEGMITDKSDNFVPTGVPPCFAVGTEIATPAGKTAVEALAIGDPILTADGRIVRVQWIGHQTTHKLFSGPNMQPVRIRAGALGEGLPNSDLTVTADHGMIIDGLVINASALVNGGSIDWVPMADLPDRVTYYHIETEAHELILANGAPAETFVDIPGRMAFDNYQEYLDLYGAERIIPEMDRPRIASQRLLPDAIKARLGIVDEVIDFDMALTA